MDFPADGTTAPGHAYWVYGVSLRDASGTAPLGKVDVRSEGFGVGDPAPSETQHGAGALTGGRSRRSPTPARARRGGPRPQQPVRDALDITATNVSP